MINRNNINIIGLPLRFVPNGTPVGRYGISPSNGLLFPLSRTKIPNWLHIRPTNFLIIHSKEITNRNKTNTIGLSQMSSSLVSV